MCAYVKAPKPVTVVHEADIKFGDADGTPLLLDLYRPAVASVKPLPVVVYIHGGGWIAGDKWWQTPRPFLVADGFVVASVNHRLSGEATFPAQIHDVKAAVRWLRANAADLQIDPDRIGTWGFSSGGHLASLLGTSADLPDLEGRSGSPGHSSRVQAVVSFAGPTDLMAMGGWHLEGNSPESKLIGHPLKDRPDLADRANPIAYLRPDAPPFLILHGDQDRVVPINQSELLCDALERAGVEVTYVPIKGGDHGVVGSMNPSLQELELMVSAFFLKHLVR